MVFACLNYDIILRTYCMSSTPLNESLLFFKDYLLDFKIKYNIQKLNFMVFTDGRASDDIFYPRVDGEKYIFRDPYNNKIYAINKNKYRRSPIAVTNMLFQVIKGRDSSIRVTNYFFGAYNYNCVRLCVPFNNKNRIEFNKKRIHCCSF